jgi:glycosyltransferase involved in cell wall biosynthesis
MSMQKKPSVLVVADYPNWAYHHIAKFIREALRDEFDIYIDFACLNRRPEFKSKNVNNIQKVKNTVRDSIQRLQFRNVRKDGTYDIVLYLAYYLDVIACIPLTCRKTIKGIYTQGFPPRGLPNDYDSLNKIDFKDISLHQFIDTYLKDADAIVCGAPVIASYYSQYFKPVYFANDTLDETAFIPREPAADDHTKFVIGWTGTPDRDFKGFHTHVVPAVNQAKLKCPGIELKTRFSGSMKTLPFFYQGVDLVVIASEADAGPSLFVEAALSGIPSISTPIGYPLSVIKNGVNGFFVERNVDAIAEKIVYLYNHRELLNAMKSRIRSDYINLFGGQVQAENWKRIFRATLSTP